MLIKQRPLKIFIFLLFFILQEASASVRKVHFFLDSVPSQSNGNRESEGFLLDFDEGWFSGEKHSAFKYNHSLARFLCLFADSSYTDVFSEPEENLLRKNYRALGIKDSAMEFHYDVNYSDSIWGNDQCACSFASLEITLPDGRKRNLILAVIRGTPFNSNEWLSNLNINDTGGTQNDMHKGFALAASVTHTQLISYMLRHKIVPSESCILITGHSRGAAVANILSKLLLEDDFFSEGDIYTYTFASPNTTTDISAHDDKYGFIWNIVNPEDVVPTVPLNRGNWLFTKYGHTKVFSSAVTEGRENFLEGDCKKINDVYRKLSGRDYAPFTTGPLVPVLITKLFESLASNVDKYYSGALSLHTKFSSLMRRLFPEKEYDETPADVKKGGPGSWFVSWLNRRTDGGVDYLKLAFSDMHTNDIYLSFLLSLGEENAFSQEKYSVTELKGYAECAVFDGNGNVMARIIDGKIRYEDTNLPVVLVPTGAKSVLIACPVSETYKAVVTDDSLLPSPLPVTAEYFDEAGVYLESSRKKYLYPRNGKAYEFVIGKKRLERYASGVREIESVKVPEKESRKYIRDARLKPQLAFNIVPELYTDTNWDLGGGVHMGCPLVYGSLLTSFGLTKFGKSAEISPGIGNQISIFENIKFENEAFARCLWLEKNDSDDDMFNLVPSFRSSLSMKMIGRLTFFTAGVFDFKIADFNDDAFDPAVRKTTISTFRITDRVRVAPSIQFGLRF